MYFIILRISLQIPFNINIFRNSPPITTTIIIISVTLSILASTEVISKYALTLDWYGIQQRHEYYRLITGFLFFGEISLYKIFFFLENIKYVTTLEKETYAGKRKEMLFLFGYCWIMILITARFIKYANDATLMFFSILSYIWVKKHPEQLMIFMFLIPFPASYLPVLNIGLAILQKQNLVVPICSILLGHLYWFIDVVVPSLTNVDIIRKIVGK